LGGRSHRRMTSFDDAGMVIFRDSTLGTPELWCRCDHGPHGFLSIAAHAHADALSIELRHGGVDIFADPGTYCYHGEPEWRRYFRSTRGHNTLELDGAGQAVDGGPFLWLSHPVSSVQTITGLDGGSEAIWSASHDGYLQRFGAVVWRRLRLRRGAGQVVLDHWIAAAQARSARLAFHLGPAVACQLDGNVARLEWRVGEDSFVGHLILPDRLDWTSHRGDSNGGWYSPGFGQKCRSVTLVGQGLLAPLVHLITEFQIGEQQFPR
jgi:hypothetical protein